MQVTTFQVGQRVFRAELLKFGRDVDNGVGDCFTTKAEAQDDGESMADNYDPEWQKRNPDAIDFVVREYEIDSVDDDGITWGGFTV